MWKRVVCQDDQKCDLFKIPKGMVKINQVLLVSSTQEMIMVYFQ